MKTIKISFFMILIIGIIGMALMVAGCVEKHSLLGYKSVEEMKE